MACLPPRLAHETLVCRRVGRQRL